MMAVRVWVAPLLVPDTLRRSLVASLSAAERARAGRYRAAADASPFCTARGWLRHVLAAEIGTPPARVPLSETSGKPSLAGGVGPCFNVSHAGDLAVVAVADRAVGVDIEHTDSGPRALYAASVACAAAEVAELDRLPPAERAGAFLRVWTAKEAYLKARGVGLAVAPDRVAIGASRDGAVPVTLTGESGPARWWVRELCPAPGYVGAVAAEGTDWVVELRSTDELEVTAGAGPSRVGA